MNNIDKNIFNSYATVEAALLNDLATESRIKGKKARSLKGEGYYVRYDGVKYDITPEQCRIYRLIRNNYNMFAEQLNSAKSDILGFWENVWGERLPRIIANLEKGVEICEKYWDAFKAYIIEGAKETAVEKSEESEESEEATEEATEEKNEEKKEEAEEATEEAIEEKNDETEAIVTSNEKRELTKEEIKNAPDFMPIKGYEGLYEVGKDGTVWSLNYNHTGQRKQLRPSAYDEYGHLNVRLYKDGKGKMRPVHQLVLNAYLPKPSEDLEVLHKNSTASDNRLENLKWGPHVENINDPHRIALVSEAMTNHPDLSTPVLCVETDVVYPSVREASRQTGINRGNISSCLNGKLKSAGGFHWRKV